MMFFVVADHLMLYRASSTKHIHRRMRPANHSVQVGSITDSQAYDRHLPCTPNDLYCSENDVSTHSAVCHSQLEIPDPKLKIPMFSSLTTKTFQDYRQCTFSNPYAGEATGLHPTASLGMPMINLTKGSTLGFYFRLNPVQKHREQRPRFTGLIGYDRNSEISSASLIDDIGREWTICDQCVGTKNSRVMEPLLA